MEETEKLSVRSDTWRYITKAVRIAGVQVYIMIACKQSMFQSCCVDGFLLVLEVTQICIDRKPLQIKGSSCRGPVSIMGF